MKLLFIHTPSKVICDINGNHYTNGSYNEIVWNRYLNFSNDLTVIMKLNPKKIDNNVIAKDYNIIPKSIKFFGINDNLKNIYKYFSIKERKKKYIIYENAIKNSDVVIIRLPGDVTPVNICKKYKKPYILEVVGDPFYSLWYHSFKGKILSFGSKKKMYNAIKPAQYVIYVTKYYLEKKYPTNGIYENISNAYIDCDSETKFNIIDKYKNVKNNLSLGTIGNVDVKYKGQKYVFDAIKILKEKYNIIVKYYLVGGGNPKKLKNYALKNGIEKQIFFEGNLNYKSIKEWFKKINIYIQPSLTEGLPRSLMEAMNAGIYSLATNVGGIPELLSENCLIDIKKNISTQLVKKINKLNILDISNEIEKNFKTIKNYDFKKLNIKREKFYKLFLEKEGIVNE